MSGEWREVSVADIPGVFEGTDPVAAPYAMPGALVFFGIWARLLYDFTAHPQRWSIPVIVLAAGWSIFAVLNYFVWRFVYRGLYDLRARTICLEGPVIYPVESDHATVHVDRVAGQFQANAFAFDKLDRLRRRLL